MVLVGKGRINFIKLWVKSNCVYNSQFILLHSTLKLLSLEQLFNNHHFN
jgi:hypothetical protein